MNQFIKKGYGRIFVADPEKIDAVKLAMMETDSSEYEGYYPEGLIVPFTGNGQDLIYTHKFEMDIDALTQLCWNRGIWIWCVSQYNNPTTY